MPTSAFWTTPARDLPISRTVSGSDSCVRTTCQNLQEEPGRSRNSEDRDILRRQYTAYVGRTAMDIVAFAPRFAWSRCATDRGTNHSVVRSLSVDIDEGKKAEDQLRRSETYLAEAQWLSHSGSAAFNDTTLLYWSDETYRILGFDPRDGLPTYEAAAQRTHPDDQERVREQARRAVQQKRDYKLEYRILLPTGSIKHIEMNAHPKFSESGELVEVVSTLIDVTERKRAQEVGSERLLRQLEAEISPHMNRLSMMGELAALRWLTKSRSQSPPATRNNARAAPQFPGYKQLPPADLGEVVESAQLCP